MLRPAPTRVNNSPKCTHAKQIAEKEGMSVEASRRNAADGRSPTAGAKPKRFLRLPEVDRRSGIKHSLIHRLETQGRFPRRIKITDHASAWLESEIEAWIDQRVSAGRATE